MFDEVSLRREFEAKGYSFDIFVDPAGQQWMGFIHPVDEIVVPLEGQVSIFIDGVHHQPAVGEEVFIPARAVHDAITSNDGPSRWAYGYKSP